MEMENSSSRSPDSSCPDYYPFPATLEEPANVTQNSGILDRILNSDISSSTGSSLSSSAYGSLPNHMLDGNNERNVQIPDNGSRGQGYQSNGRSVINFASIGSKSSKDVYGSIPKYPSRGPNYHSNLAQVSNFPAVGSYWPRSSSVANNSRSSLSSNYQNSSMTSEPVVHNLSSRNGNKERISHGPTSRLNPEELFLFPSTNMPSTSTTTASSLPKPENSEVSSSVSSNSNYISAPPSNTSYVSSQSCARQRKNNIAARIITCKAQTSLSANRNLPAQQYSSFYNLIAGGPEQSANNSLEERGLKRKSSSVLSNSNCLSSASSSSSNYVNSAQNLSHISKKNKVPGSSSYLQPEDIDDDIQIITPETNRDFSSHSSSSDKGQSSSSRNSTTSWSAANHPAPSVIADSSRLNSAANTARQTNPECDLNQSSPQAAQETPPVQSIFNEEFDQMLDNVWFELDGIASPANVAATAAPAVETITIPPVSEIDDSSSSSIVVVHEESKDSSSCGTTKPPSPILDKVPNDVPSPITIEDSPKNDELLELKAKQEAENVKEDFKKLLEDELICNICTELLIKPITLGCSHTFCKFCISEWKAKKNQCPMCRTSIATETPCLFLDNFISKAVEQLDPASVEKRLEIIKTREEQLKNKVCKPPAQQSHQSLSIPPYMIEIHAFGNREQRNSDILRRQNETIMRQRARLLDFRYRQQSLSMHHMPLNIPQSSRISHPSSNIPQQSSNIPQQSLNIPQQSPSIPLLPSELLLNSSNHVSVPMNGYFFF